MRTKLGPGDTGPEVLRSRETKKLVELDPKGVAKSLIPVFRGVQLPQA